MPGVLKPGEVIERYVVERELGRGGMAVVYRVRHRQLHTLHALKVLTLPGDNVQARLITEGRVQATVRHAHLVAVNDVLDVEGQPGLLMEYVDGPSLDRLIARGLSVAEAEQIFRGILAGVGHAHAHGLVHRDLKPGNVLLAPLEGNWIPKVTDFGLAKVLWDGAEQGHTRTNVALGTPDYMAPEQIRDARTVDSRADVFSLGCMLYEMVTGRPPFAGQDLLTVLNAVAAGDFVPPEQHVPDLPSPVRNAIMGMMEVDRDKRLPDCAAVLDVLDGKPPGPRLAPETWARHSIPVMVRSEWKDLAAPGPEASPPPSEAPQLPPPPVSQPGLRLAWAVGGVAAVALTAVAVVVLALTLSAQEDEAPPVATVAVTEPAPVPVDELPESEPGTPAVEPPVEPAPATPAAKKPAATSTAGASKPKGAVAIGGGTVRVTGDAKEVELVSKTAKWPPGAVPADTYTVMARFPGNKNVVTAGVLTIRDGDAVTLACSAAFVRCVPR
ncbi:MAG: serine/threonine-protein kinase [Myxococcota bacterium]